MPHAERQEEETFAEKPSKAPQPLWVILIVSLVPNVLTSATAVVVALVKSAGANAKSAEANAKAEASYKVMQDAIQLLQAHDGEHDRNYAAVAAHLQVVEAWLGSMHPNGQDQLVLPVPHAANKRTWRPNFPPALTAPVQRKIEFRPTLDEVADDIKSGRTVLREVYEGPPEDAPQWTRDAARAAASEAK